MWVIPTVVLVIAIYVLYEFRFRKPDQIVLETDSKGSRYLFLSEIFYPGWKAYVNGKNTRILRGNYIFRVIEIPSGKHRIRVSFEPWSIKIGVGLTLFILFTLLAMMVHRSLTRPF